MIRIDKTGIQNHAGRVRNAGIKLAITPWIGFVDDDDTLDNMYVSNLKSHLEQENPEVIIFRMDYKDGKNLPPPGEKVFKVAEVGISFCFRKELCTDCFKPSHLEDFILLDTFRKAQKRIFISPHVMYHVLSN